MSSQNPESVLYQLLVCIECLSSSRAILIYLGVSMFPQQPIKALDTGSPQALDTVTRWLERCISKHAKCVPLESELGFYPTRLLDIVGSTGKACVIETHQIVQRGEFKTGSTMHP
jgi:hypothetical protein